jgi:hypothetical protein
MKNDCIKGVIVLLLSFISFNISAQDKSQQPKDRSEKHQEHSVAQKEIIYTINIWYENTEREIRRAARAAGESTTESIKNTLTLIEHLQGKLLATLENLTTASIEEAIELNKEAERIYGEIEAELPYLFEEKKNKNQEK